MKLKLGMAGLGYWGPNLLRNLKQLPNCEVKWVCDLDEKRVVKMQRGFNIEKGTTDINEVIADPEVDAFVNALPVSLHYSATAKALQAGKHCLVEKPLAMRSVEAAELTATAEDRGLTLMTGHTFEYNSAVRKIKEYIDRGDLGDIFYFSCQRVNLGIIRQDVNVLWNLAPHDISILLYWLGTEPESVSARGACYLQEGVEDLVTASLLFPGGKHAQILASWLNPEKKRKISIVGSKRMIIYDDVSLDQKIQVYDKGVDRIQRDDLGDFGEFQLKIRTGDLVIPQFEFVEPLRTECEHFVECCTQAKKPLTDGRNGLRVVRVLEACDRSMKENGRLVRLDEI